MPPSHWQLSNVPQPPISIPGAAPVAECSYALPLSAASDICPLRLESLPGRMGKLSLV